jgi:hypothetical protein
MHHAPISPVSNTYIHSRTHTYTLTLTHTHIHSFNHIPLAQRHKLSLAKAHTRAHRRRVHYVHYIHKTTRQNSGQADRQTHGMTD